MKNNSATLPKINGSKFRIAVVQALFNQSITDGLWQGCNRALAASKVPKSKIYHTTVPGSFELGFMAKQLALTQRHDAIICLGAVIQGETKHFDYVCDAATKGILRAGLETGVPVIFGVVTAHNLKQAQARSAYNKMNRGYDAGNAALLMISNLKKLQQ